MFGGASYMRLAVCLRFFCAAQNKIHRYVVVIRQLDQDFRWNIQFAALIIAVYPLRTGKNLAQLALRQVMILPQIPNPLIHAIT